ncbi:hypothetical protein [Streptomyces lydicus]|uniref:hypothetical protein n=1 Tax=Streptomyces lydicus TaxID=47763 RepID=UPI0010100CB3|nr:hypothetical protein [Streptomyces lydicus]MCZ1012312.1 hypothetical protein [Streptomyces lydicus]
MNWAQLLEDLLFAATVAPPLLLWFDLLSRTETLVLLAGTFTTFTASTTWAFLHGEAGNVAWNVTLTVTTLLVLRRRRENTHKNTAKPRGAKPQV